MYPIMKKKSYSWAGSEHSTCLAGTRPWVQSPSYTHTHEGIHNKLTALDQKHDALQTSPFCLTESVSWKHLPLLAAMAISGQVLLSPELLLSKHQDGGPGPSIPPSPTYAASPVSSMPLTVPHTVPEGPTLFVPSICNALHKTPTFSPSDLSANGS